MCGNSPEFVMDSKVLPRVFLEDFLDACPKSALVLTSHSGLLSGDSLKVCYANRAFLDIIGDDFGAATSNLTSLLEARVSSSGDSVSSNGSTLHAESRRWAQSSDIV